MIAALGAQVAVLFILAIPIACVSWTVTHEEVFREVRERCEEKSRASSSLLGRKFFYVFTCEYCFSHYVAIVALVATRYTLVYQGWLGYVIAWFSLVWIANTYMSLFGRLRLDIRHENQEIAIDETRLKGKARGRGLAPLRSGKP